LEEKQKYTEKHGAPLTYSYPPEAIQEENLESGKWKVDEEGNFASGSSQLNLTIMEVSMSENPSAGIIFKFEKFQEKAKSSFLGMEKKKKIANNFQFKYDKTKSQIIGEFSDIPVSELQTQHIDNSQVDASASAGENASSSMEGKDISASAMEDQKRSKHLDKKPPELPEEDKKEEKVPSSHSINIYMIEKLQPRHKDIPFGFDSPRLGSERCQRSGRRRGR